jgi:ribonuclease HI
MQSGLKETLKLGNYLGVPALGKAPRVQDFQYMVDKVKARLTGWKTKHLSLAGRITLAKSVIQAIPIYPMMTMPIPRTCLNEIEKIQRAFIWGDTLDKKKAHLIGWETMTKPKQYGGMGFRTLHSMNVACIMKLGWSLMTREQSLWGDVMIGKYGRDGWAQGRVIAKPTDSPLWKAIVTSWPHLDHHKCWSVGKGNKINFWTDKCIDGSVRISDYANDIPDTAGNWKVQDVATAHGSWNFDMINNLVPASIVKKMHAIVLPHVTHDEDTQLWPGSSTGRFTVASAYQLIATNTVENVDNKWSQIWKLETIERVRVFIWQMAHDRLLTNSRLARWHLGGPDCHSCVHFEETLLHVLRDCPVAVNIWNHLLPRHDKGQFFLVSLHDWISFNLVNKFGHSHGNSWNAIWATTCHLLWQWRNKCVHDPEFVYPHRPWVLALDYVAEYKRNMRGDSQGCSDRHKQEINVSWNAPPLGWHALDTDGAAKHSDRTAGCGGIVRNNTGAWVEGFAKALGDTTAYMAELWGVFEGLVLARRLGVAKLEVRIDSAVIAQNLHDRKEGSIMGITLMKMIYKILEDFQEVRIINVFHEANRCADMLANIGCKISDNIVYFVHPPSEVVQLVDDDYRGVSFPRTVSL